MHRIMASPSSSAGGEGSVEALAAFEPLPLPRGFAVGVSAVSMFFVCWPLVARPDLRTSSRVKISKSLSRRECVIRVVGTRHHLIYIECSPDMLAMVQEYLLRKGRKGLFAFTQDALGLMTGRKVSRLPQDPANAIQRWKRHKSALYP